VREEIAIMSVRQLAGGLMGLLFLCGATGCSSTPEQPPPDMSAGDSGTDVGPDTIDLGRDARATGPDGSDAPVDAPDAPDAAPPDLPLDTADVSDDSPPADAADGSDAPDLVTAAFATRPSRSSTIALSDDESRVLVVNVDHGSVSVFNAATTALVATVAVGKEPSAVVIRADNQTAYVANRADATIQKLTGINTATPTAGTPVAVGSEPLGLALSPSGASLYVTEWAEGTVALVDTATLTVTARVQVKNPRGIAVTNNGDHNDSDERVIVTEFFGTPGPGPEASDNSRTGVVHIFDANLRPLRQVSFPPRDSGITPTGAPSSITASPNQLYSVAIDNGRFYTTSIAVSPAAPSVFNGNVQSLVLVGHLDDLTEATGPLGSQNLAKLVIDNIPSPGTFTRNFLGDIVDIAFAGSDQGEAYVASRAGDAVQRLHYNASTGTLEFGATVGSNQVPQIDMLGCGPTGLVAGRNTRRLFVNCWESRNLGIIDLNLQRVLGVVRSSPAPSTNTEIVQEAGKRFFFTGRDRWSSGAWSSCASCHAEGLTDGVTWSFTAGPRQTTSLDGSFSKGPGPVKQRIFNWTAIFDEIHDFDRNTRTNQGGKGAITVALPGTPCDPTAATSTCASNLTCTHVDPYPATTGACLANSARCTDSSTCASGLTCVSGICEQACTSDADCTVVAGAVCRGQTQFASGGLCRACGTLVQETAHPAQNGVGGLQRPLSEVAHLDDTCTPQAFGAMEAWIRLVRPPRGQRLCGGSGLDATACAASVAHGAQLFVAGQCQSCHGGSGWTASRLFYTPSTATNAALFTNVPALAGNQLASEDPAGPGTGVAPAQIYCVRRNVGTFGSDALEVKSDGTRAQGLGGYNVPSLYGLSVGAPYLHHGQATSLDQLLSDDTFAAHRTAFVSDFLTGATADQDRQDLINYLHSIDASSAEVPLPAADATTGAGDLCPASF
jgi:YVTN family beta-propeller protein